MLTDRHLMIFMGKCKNSNLLLFFHALILAERHKLRLSHPDIYELLVLSVFWQEAISIGLFISHIHHIPHIVTQETYSPMQYVFCFQKLQLLCIKSSIEHSIHPIGKSKKTISLFLNDLHIRIQLCQNQPFMYNAWTNDAVLRKNNGIHEVFSNCHTIFSFLHSVWFCTDFPLSSMQKYSLIMSKQ